MKEEKKEKRTRKAQVCKCFFLDVMFFLELTSPMRMFPVIFFL